MPDAIDWPKVRRQLLTNAQVLKLAGVSHRLTLIRWREREQDPFPPPVLSLPATGRGGRPLELWARSEVQDWLSRQV